MKLVGLDCILVNSYSQLSKPLDLNEVLRGSPNSLRTSVCVVLPLWRLAATDSPVASAMLSLPELAHATSAHDIASRMNRFKRLCMASPHELAPPRAFPSATA